jgi:hypothetical protein
VTVPLRGADETCGDTDGEKRNDAKDER